MHRSSFSGRVKLVSVSPHGDPEGFWLEDDTFVKVPPHTVLARERFRVGNLAEGSGELFELASGAEGNTALSARGVDRVFHRALVLLDGVPATSDPEDKALDETLKAQHKQVNEARKGAVPGREITLSARILGLGLRPHGPREVDRLFLEGNVSAHLPKELHAETADLKLGDAVTVVGEAREFALGTFLKVKALRRS